MIPAHEIVHLVFADKSLSVRDVTRPDGGRIEDALIDVMGGREDAVDSAMNDGGAR